VDLFLRVSAGVVSGVLKGVCGCCVENVVAQK
jgi:hypothetical protein